MEEIEQRDPIIIEYFNYGMSKHAKLVIPPGKLCILIGENNNGKSCLFYGLEWLLFNDALAKTLINNKSLEEDKNAELKVRITQGDYFIEIKRSMSAISYNINGVLHNKKLNKQSIFDVDENVRVPGFVYVKDCMYPLFNMQGEDRGLFPISENNDQAIYALFEKLLGLINSKKMISAAQNELNDAMSQYNMYDAEYKKTEAKLSKINEIANELDTVSINDIICKTEKAEQKMTKLTNGLNTLKSLGTLYIVQAPIQVNPNALNECMQEYKKYLSAKSGLESTIAQVQGLQGNKIDTINIDRLNLCQKVLAKLKEFKTTINNALFEIKNLIAQKQDAETQKNALQKEWDAIEVCPMCGQPKGVHICH